ncbi:sodium:calcium antiporter [Salipaludibacillus aurantiacus]|uniref:Cation:H+ antiporter n=1 Tax=Salipaludibacillus aurantiacus TaxID=1601833 RepID=A0A1H9TCN2_9BACI|nr:sodium:calcium antiporter [Salipaludibacillus aurantiacus]SER94866.1 cation:H+ antiporter [Salipaludibacillus aurantiacus]
MMYVVFILAALITIYSAVKLSSFADVIGERTKLGGMMAGTILLAGATSLPEVTTSLTAISLNNPDIAVSNVLGSNLFNLLILAVADVYFRRRQMFSNIGLDHLMTGFVNVGLMAFVFIAVLSPTGYHFFNIGIEMYLLVLFYTVGMKMISSSSQANKIEAEAAAESSYHTGAISLKKAKFGFALAALVIFIAGSALTVSGDAIAAATGLSSSFIGTFLIAGATSLPEVVTVIVAVQLANYHLAVGNILGSNMFNLLILVLSDFFYRSGPVLSFVSPVVLITAAAVIILNVVILAGMIFAQSKISNTYNYFLPSVIVIVFYFISSYFLWTLS